MSKYFTRLFFIIFPLFAMAQSTGTIQGKLINALDEQVANVEIRLVETNGKTLTNTNGEFVFKNLSPGIYNLYPIYDGFQFGIETIQLKSGEVLDVTLYIQMTTYNLDEV
ncbi:MAG: carboxypeptidase-like regulatory domain-containing protein, partial [Gelidibacter sp.]